MFLKYLKDKSLKYLRKGIAHIKGSFETLYNATFNKPIGEVYMFHRVMPGDKSIKPIAELNFTPARFEQFIKDRIDKFDFISVDEMYSVMANKQKRTKPFAVITFDDGYSDNYEFAYPILKKYDVPFCIYLSVNLVNAGGKVWNYPLIAERIIRNNEYLELADGTEYVCQTEEDKDKTFLSVKSWILNQPYDKLKDNFRMQFGKYLNDDVFVPDTLTWNQVEKLSKDRLCTFGSHTMSHCRLSFSEQSWLEYELSESKKEIESHTGKSVEHLSYPYGWKTDVSAAAAEYAEKAGYKTAMISWGGAVRKYDRDMYHVKRIMVFEDERANC